MRNINIIEIKEDDSGLRIDKWFKQKYPNANFGYIHKLVRTGQIRLNGGRVKANIRIKKGDCLRIPPIIKTDVENSIIKIKNLLNDSEVRKLQDYIIFHDDNHLILNKPSGLSVQGGSKTRNHLDGMLDYLKLGNKERPRLVHRLDKYTTGVLILARNKKTAQFLTNCFINKTIRKLYWAITVGVPTPKEGVIELKISKKSSPLGEKMMIDDINGKYSKSLYKVLDQSGSISALVGMEPLTGRTHQLRVHLSNALGVPILGDGKYGGKEAYIDNKIGKSFCLHSRAVRIPIKDSNFIEVIAPAPKHLISVCKILGLEILPAFDNFLEI